MSTQNIMFYKEIEKKDYLIAWLCAYRRMCSNWVKYGIYFLRFECISNLQCDTLQTDADIFDKLFRICFFFTLLNNFFKKLSIKVLGLWMFLTLKAPVITAADHNFLFIYFFIFQRKQVLTFHVNHLPSRWFTWKVKTYFLWKIKKKFECCLQQSLLGALRVN